MKSVWTKVKKQTYGEFQIETPTSVASVKGTEFDMELVIREFEGDEGKGIIGLVREGLGLVQKEYLGGSGSRGYGKVTFRDVTLDGEDFFIE